MANPPPNFRIGTVWAFLAVDAADNSEGVIGQLMPDGTWMPYVCADGERLAQLRPRAAELARQTGTEIRLARFTLREDLETWGEPGKAHG
jgi:hypothetical protein